MYNQLVSLCIFNLHISHNVKFVINIISNKQLQKAQFSAFDHLPSRDIHMIIWY